MSTMSTSSRKREREVHWEEIIHSLDLEQFQGEAEKKDLIQEFTKLCSTATYYSTLPAPIQKVICTSCGIEGWDEKILEKMKVSHGGLSVIDSVRNCDWDPSTTLPLQDFLCVLRVHLWEFRFVGEKKDLNRALFNIEFNSSTAQTSTPPPSSAQASTVSLPSSAHQIMTSYPEYCLHFGTKEASGIPLLGTTLIAFVALLSERGGTAYKMDMEFPVVVHTRKRGQKPSCDSAITAITSVNLSVNLPVILYEYKPNVHPNPLKVNPDHLMELFLQGCYCLWQYELESIVHCLTDLDSWHYLKLKQEGREGKVVGCQWCHSIPKNIDINSHVAHLKLFISNTTTPETL